MISSINRRLNHFLLIVMVVVLNDHCSALGVAKNSTHPTFIAQNLDIEGFRHGYQTLLHIAEDGDTPEQYIFTIAGVLAANGMNNRSIGVCVNTLMQLSACSDGLPVDFVVRGILSARTEKEALNFVKTVKHASGQNYLIGSGERIINFEASAKKVVEFRIQGRDRLVYHTNHPLANDDWKPWHKRWMERIPQGQLKLGDSYVRFASLESRLHDSVKVVDEDFIQNILRSKDSGRSPVCRPHRPGVSVFTFGSFIMNLSDKPSLLISVGPPDKNDYLRFEFDKRK
ncbi:MAG: C45 family peptidase [bacterium]